MTYRVGNHQPQNVYRGEQYIGVMFTAEDAALAVEALNGHAAVSYLEGHGYDVVLVPQPCPTCTGPIRETVGMVCQTCGTDYGAAAPAPAHVMRDYDEVIATLGRSRETQGVSISTTAEQAGMSRSTLSEAFNGHHGLVAHNLFALAHALGFDLALVPREGA